MAAVARWKGARRPQQRGSGALANTSKDPVRPCRESLVKSSEDFKLGPVDSKESPEALSIFH